MWEIYKSGSVRDVELLKGSYTMSTRQKRTLRKTLGLVVETCIAGTCLFLTGCPTDPVPAENCTPADNKVVELTADVSGKTYFVGDTVTITWKVDGTKITNGQVVIDVSIDNGISWSAIPSQGIAVAAAAECMTYRWPIGKENEFVEYASVNAECILRIHQYSEIQNGVVFANQIFTVKKK
jgi:hypothetical protein